MDRTTEHRPDRLSLLVHEQEVAERESARNAEMAALEARRRTERRSPEALGLEQCPRCQWWRTPIPESAWSSLEAFRTYLELARVRCMCTTSRCRRCDEPMAPDHPTPAYYSVERQKVVWAGGFVFGMAHGARCRGGRQDADLEPDHERGHDVE